MLSIIAVIASVVASIVATSYLYLLKRFSYWKERGVIHDPPSLYFGNMREFGRTKPLYQPIREFYQRYKGQAPFGGFYLFMRRAVIVLDLELVKQVLIKDFSNFAHRGNYYNERDDPLSGHLFNLDGPKWRSMRAKLTPTFTSGKMKFMLPTMVDVAKNFVRVLGELIDEEANKVKAVDGVGGVGESKEVDTGDVAMEMKELLARFTTDVIGSCAFGLECNSLKDPNTQFRLMGKKAFSQRRHGRIMFALMVAFPELCRKFGVKSVPDDISEFFMGVVRDTVEYREREGVHRNDFMNLLIDLKNRNDTEGLTLEEIAAQAFVFFLAGFETSSSTMGFALYELAVNQHIQDRARTEVIEALERHGQEFTYECLHDLRYLKQIVQETMRRYSIASFVLRKTINDYKVPAAAPGSPDHVIEKGTVIIIPVDAIHHDPDVYPNPEIFDPDRFLPSEVEKRHPMSWLPFGEGPRNCIGLRFGEMQAMVGLAMLLHRFKFTPSKQTKIPIEIDLKNFILASKGGIVLNIEKI